MTKACSAHSGFSWVKSRYCVGVSCRANARPLISFDGRTRRMCPRVAYSKQAVTQIVDCRLTLDRCPTCSQVVVSLAFEFGVQFDVHRLDSLLVELLARDSAGHLRDSRVVVPGKRHQLLQ
jgi:hypothetical protein